jgi:hypothetical protein
MIKSKVKKKTFKPVLESTLKMQAYFLESVAISLGRHL